MAKLTATAGVQITDGGYEATVLEITQCEPTEKSPNQKPWLKWLFAVYDGSADGLEMTAASSCALGPKAKARAWIESLLGRRLEPNEEVDTDQLTPRDCQVIIKNDPDSGFARIADVLPPRPTRRPAGRPASATTDGVTV